MARERNKVLDYAVYLAMRLVESLVRVLPLDAAYAVARFAGDMMFRFDRRHTDRALENLRHSFGHWSEDRRRQVARLSLRNLFYLGLESLLTTFRITPYTWRRYVSLRQAGEALRLVTERRSGMIFLTGHVGNFEVVGHTMATLGFPSVAIARRLNNPYLDAHLMGIRERSGQRILDKFGATAEAPAVLDARGVVSIIADQDAGPRGVFVDFFGRPASTYKSFGLLAMSHQTPIVVGYGRRVNESFRFEMVVQRIIRPHEWADQDDPLRWITQEYTAALERAIREAPEQYFWHYRRWTSQPRAK
ncbi:MAG TPA: lipid A biosynthesis acyltransferase [Phycisphaerales bacterium]|nr:lipid A biosynthesis acyltransferase [Phycisphaerales bacterium]